MTKPQTGSKFYRFVEMVPGRVVHLEKALVSGACAEKTSL